MAIPRTASADSHHNRTTGSSQILRRTNGVMTRGGLAGAPGGFGVTVASAFAGIIGGLGLATS
jgi:hypothetical protein